MSPRVRSRVLWVGGVLLAGLVVFGHVGLWLDESIPPDAKRRLTTLNALAWAVIVLPAIGVSYWLRGHQRASAARRQEAEAARREAD